MHLDDVGDRTNGESGDQLPGLETYWVSTTRAILEPASVIYGNRQGYIMKVVSLPASQ